MNRVKTRKPHRKSRNGCLPCKGRHIKCGEQKPSCANCVKQGVACEYPTLASREASHTSPLPLETPAFTPSSVEGGSGTFYGQPSPPAVGKGPENAASSGTSLELNIPQLRLLHHYINVTAKTLAAHTDAEEVFKTKLVDIAFDHPYLLQATLSLSALHMSRLVDPKEAQEYLIQADRYRDAALDGFHTTVRNIDESNFKAVLLFAGTLFPHACITSIAASSDLNHAFESVVSNLLVTRRVRPMVVGFYTQMKVSELGRVIPEDVKNIDFNQREPPLDTELVQLRKFAELIHQLYPPDIVDAYSHACHLLEIVFQVAAESPRSPSDALLKTWIHLVPERYIELLSEKQPGSLIIFSHFAVIVNRAAEHYWYLEGFAEQIVRLADHFVPSEWKSWLQWPKEQILDNSRHSTPSSVRMS